MELDHDKLQEAFKNQKKLNVIDECDLRMLLLVVHLIQDKNCWLTLSFKKVKKAQTKKDMIAKHKK